MWLFLCQIKPKKTVTGWPEVGIWWKAFLWNCGVGPDSTLHWRIMRALPPLSCINYNRPRCTTLHCKRQSANCAPSKCMHSHNLCKFPTLCSSVHESTAQCVCLCLASITAGAGAPLWYILRLTHIQPTTCQLIHLFFCVYIAMYTVNPNLASSYIYSFSPSH